MRRSQSLTLRESFTFTRLSMLIGPMGSPKRETDGGAAGNRTRVQFAYYVGVYPHSRLPGTSNIGCLVRQGKGALVLIQQDLAHFQFFLVLGFSFSRCQTLGFD